LEEAVLLEFFGIDYKEYAKKTPIRIPFIKGYKKLR
jgi:protein-S-isoprenylcysteine O-methyltransferase Ste14